MRKLQIDSELLTEVVRFLAASGTITRKCDLRAAIGGQSRRILALHQYLKKHGERFESEWRNEFLSVFPEAADSLPPLEEVESWQSELFNLIDGGDLAGLTAFIDRIGIRNIRFKPEEAFEDGRNAGFGEEPKFLPFEIYPVGSPNDEGITPADYAAAQDALEISEFLRNLVSELEDRWRRAYREGFAADASKPTLTLVFTRSNDALYEGKHVTIEGALEEATRLGVKRLRVTLPVDVDPKFGVSYVNAFSAAGITDNDIRFSHD